MTPIATDTARRAAHGDRAALVTGAAGAVGPTIVRRLLAEGYRVRALDAKPLLRGDLPVGVECFQGEITDRTVLARAMQGMDVVFHLAAKLHINNPDPALRDEYYRVNVEGTRGLVEAAVAADVSRFVFFSTVCVYGASAPPTILTEDAAIRCDSWYGETKREAERIVLGQAPAVVLRLAAVYGPRMKGNYLRLLQALQRRLFAYVGAGKNRRTLVYDEDVAAAALLAAEHPEALGQVYNVSDGRIHAFREIVESMCQALGRRPPRLHIPVSLMRTGAGMSEVAVRWLGRRAPVTRQLVDKLVEDVAVSDAKIERELHYRPQVDLARGWRQIVEALAGVHVGRDSETPSTDRAGDARGPLTGT